MTILSIVMHICHDPASSLVTCTGYCGLMSTCGRVLKMCTGIFCDVYKSPRTGWVLHLRNESRMKQQLQCTYASRYDE